jgi:spore coat polysaccharide biosynthesis protein SpsF
MNSSRLPGKISLPLTRNHNLLEFLFSRISTTGIDWWLATTNSELDNETVEIGEKLGLRIYRGSEDNVLSRYVNIAQSEQADVIVRVTADNPFVESERILEMIIYANQIRNKVYVVGESSAQPQFPLGYLPEVVSFEGLKFAQENLNVNRQYHESNVTSYLKPKFLRVFRNSMFPDYPHLRWTIDTEEDLRMVQAILRKEDISPREFTYEKILGILHQDAAIEKINSMVIQKGFGII